MTAPHTDNRRQLPFWLGATLIAGVWLSARPYIGVRHDGVLYMGQALLRLFPDAIASDLFFVFGSQDKFSVYSWLIAPVYRMFGFSQTNLVLLTLSHASLLVFVARLLWRLPNPLERWLGLVAVATFSHVYGGMSVFSFSEAFLTARSLAEPLTLGALVFLLDGRRLLALACIALGMAVHPLMSFPGLIVGWLYLCQMDRRWRWCAASVAVIVALALVGITPFSALFQVFDAEWWAPVSVANANVFVTKWTAVQWQTVVFDFVFLTGAISIAPLSLARLCKASVAGAAGLLVVSALGADWAHNVLITQLQLWRSLWLLHLLALALLPGALLWLWHQGSLGPLCSLSVALAAVAVNARWEFGFAFVAWAVLAIAFQRHSTKVSPAIVRFTTFATGLALASLTVAVAGRTLHDLISLKAPLDAKTILWVIFTSPLLSITVTALVVVAWRRGTRPLLIFITGLAIALLTSGAAFWDRRPAWSQYIESLPMGNHPFAKLMPARAQVIWPDELPAVWAVLGRPSFFSDFQGSGLLFSRATALEFARRQPVMAPLSLQKEFCGIFGVVSNTGDEADAAPAERCIPDQELIDDMCRFPQGPDFIVLRYHLSRGMVSEWSFREAGAVPKTFYLYDCLKLR